MHTKMTQHFRLLIAVIATMVAALCANAQNSAVLQESAASQDSVTRQTSIVERLNNRQSAITITAPAQLLHRAAPVVTEPENAMADNEEAEASQQEEKNMRAKGGKTVGYRVQVYADNNVRRAKSEARTHERAISASFPQYATYVSYASPYWRLRVGDFHSQYDAEKAAAEIRKSFPRYAREVRVVRDRINTR